MSIYQPFIASSLHKFLETSNDCVSIKSKQGDLIFRNQAFNSLFQTTDSSTFFSNLEKNSIISITESEVLESGQPIHDVEIMIHDSDENERVFTLSCSSWEDNNNELLGTILTLREITKTKQKERELAESTTLMNAVLDHLPVRVFWKDKDLVYLGCNTVFANDMGFHHPEELIGQDDFATSMTDEEAKMCRADDFQVLNSGIGAYGSEEVQGDGDDQVWLRVSKVPLSDASGEMIGVLGMYEFITEEKEAQIELERALRQEKELNELKTRPERRTTANLWWFVC